MEVLEHDQDRPPLAQRPQQALTTLTAESARRNDFTVLRGSAIETGSGEPLAPIRSMIRALPPADRVDADATLAEPPESSDGGPVPAGDVGRAGDEVLRLLRTLSERGPVLVVLEDLH
ncbi:MAG: hypothetical protein AAGK32_01000, partial [Actinomycetota bacterium]